MSGEPKDQAWDDWFNTESARIGFSCQPVVTALTSSNCPPRMATCPGRDSVGILAQLTPQLAPPSMRVRTKGAGVVNPEEAGAWGASRRGSGAESTNGGEP